MDRLVSNLILYRDLGEGSILASLAAVFRDHRAGADKQELVGRIYGEVKRLLDLATKYGFDTNLWHNYLTFLLITNENSFTLTAERRGAKEGSVNRFAKADFCIFKQLFDFDFSAVEKELGIDCFSILSDYRAVEKPEKSYYKSVSDEVRSLSLALAKAKDEEEFFRIITTFYRDHGVGMFALNKAFRIRKAEKGVEFIPINNADKITLSDLIGYEVQKRELIANTEAFVRGRSANNVLLYGDSGTGKSSSVKAVLNEYAGEGLRMIEIYKHQFQELSAVIAAIKNRNYRFIIFIDDLSFEEHEVEYKFLKAVIEGGVETRPDNVLLYATSNRRHLVKETWNDRNDMEFQGDIHRSDTMEEKLSLASRFGIAINYSVPNREQYHNIVRGLAKRAGKVDMDEKELLLLANRWEIRHGGVSGRTAQQFINYLAGKDDNKC
ncbi:MAG: ATP-binding protein [Clostridiales bacterium]|nr:ATP-binding protein [Clostridiales bacterium]